ncbi:MAG: hypothetical protein QM728_01595 [Gordonia sp. (in: high G+C Gram-positive bacteria)]|uniref:hypothetical protein n=1 Tax=Gordonia sp. (in: high G+C Gram-positive bacteria) TaxID=84139 RepID=UPI0039E272FB
MTWQQEPGQYPGQQPPTYGNPGYVPAPPGMAPPPGVPVPPAGQPGQPYGVPQYSADPYGMQYGGFPQPEPSGGTAITAGILSILGGVAEFAGSIVVIIALIVLSNLDASNKVVDALPDWYTAGMVVMAVVEVITGTILLIGGIALLTRRLWGRIAIVVGCAIALTTSIIGLFIDFAVAEAITSDISAGTDVDLGSGIGSTAGSIIQMIFPIVTIVLALLPATKAWCLAKRYRPS